MTLGFHFSMINHDMVSQNPAASLNLLWNQLRQTSITQQLLFQTPTFAPTFGSDYSGYATGFDVLLNPQLAIAQTMRSNQQWFV